MKGVDHHGTVAVTRRGELLARLTLVLGSSVLALGAVELMFRAALFSPTFAIERVRQPWRFADPDFDSDYWKLAFLFGTGRRAQRAGEYHPEFGWAPEATSGNPLGIIGGSGITPSGLRRPLLFYGNSFVGGATPLEARLPQVLDRMFQPRRVLNYGVAGYGVGQIYLRFAATAGSFEQPTILIGIMTHDLDRSVMTFRSGQKPVFRSSGDTLVLANLPIERDTREYLREHPPEISSYALRFVTTRLGRFLPDSLFARLRGYDDLQREKLVVNRRLLRLIQQEAERVAAPLYGVVFYSMAEFDQESWRSAFLRDGFDSLGIPYFDSKSFLLEHMQRSGETLEDLYYQDNGHPNVRGNEVLAAGIREWLRGQGEE